MPWIFRKASSQKSKFQIKLFNVKISSNQKAGANKRTALKLNIMSKINNKNMENANSTISYKIMSVEILKQAGMLKKYGIDKPSEFEIGQLVKFGLTDSLNGVIATEQGFVLCNWEQVQIAKDAKITEMKVIVIDNLNEDEIPQVIAVNNLRKRLKKAALANLILDYRDYLTKNVTGLAWAKEVPGDSTDAKIGTLLNYSYGMINGYQKIYKFHPQYLDMMDKGEMSFTNAMQLINNEQKVDEVSPDIENDPIDNPITPKKIKAKLPMYNYAGERNMVPCEPMASILITYKDGRTVDFVIEGDKSIGQLFDKDIECNYSTKKENFTNGAEYHRLDFIDKKHFIEVVILKAA